jgi:hypothetical protein
VLTNLVTIGGPRVERATFTETTTITSTSEIRPELVVQIDNDQSSVAAGERIVYNLGYTNFGNQDAEGTTVVAKALPNEYVASLECSPSVMCDVQPGQVFYDLGTVDRNGGGGTLELVVTLHYPLPAGARIFTATAVISTITPGEPLYGNHYKDIDVVSTRPDMIVNPEYEGFKPWPGKLVTYTVHYENRSPIDVTGVVITATKSRFAGFQVPNSDPCWTGVGGDTYRCAIGELGYNEPGEVLFVTTLTDTLFTPDMIDFNAIFEIRDNGQSGEDAQPGDNVAYAPMGVPNLTIEGIDADDAIWVGEPGTLKVYVKNTGTGKACGIFSYWEEDCGHLPLDLFLGLEEEPPSYPVAGSGDCYAWVPPINAGARRTVELDFGLGEGDGKCGVATTTEMKKAWLKVDNWNPDLHPNPPPWGFVPENNEWDNVFPLLGYSVYLPIISGGGASP